MAIAEAMAPCVLFVDDRQSDSPASGAELEVVAAGCSARSSPGSLIMRATSVRRDRQRRTSRCERFDGVFFVDLPVASRKTPSGEFIGRGSKSTQSSMVCLTTSFGQAPRSPPAAASGAAWRLTLIEATHIVPVPVWRRALAWKWPWASGRCLSADAGRR